MIYLEGAICASIDGSLFDCASGHLARISHEEF